jgi:hypothetical protein
VRTKCDTVVSRFHRRTPVPRCSHHCFSGILIWRRFVRRLANREVPSPKRRAVDLAVKLKAEGGVHLVSGAVSGMGAGLLCCESMPTTMMRRSKMYCDAWSFSGAFFRNTPQLDFFDLARPRASVLHHSPALRRADFLSGLHHGSRRCGILRSGYNHPKRFEAYVYPKQLDEVLRLEIRRLTDRSERLRSNSTESTAAMPPLEIPGQLQLPPWTRAATATPPGRP